MRARVLTALVALPFVLGAVFCTHPLPFFVLAVLTFAAGTWEFMRLSSTESRPFLFGSTLLFALIAFTWLRFQRGIPDQFVLGMALLFALGSMLAGFKAGEKEKPKIIFTIAEAFGWIGAPLIALMLAHQAPQTSADWYLPSPLIMVLLPLWAGDIAGILVGIGLGRHKLAPHISPKKTVEGAVGNLLATVGVAAGVGVWLLGEWGMAARGPSMTVAKAIVIGIAISVLGQAGDLFESWLKRAVGLKDSGNVLPGHGGILDRIDSLLFAAIPAVLIMQLR